MSTAKFNQWLNSDGTENYKCRAWVNFNGTGTVAIRASGNVSSITDLGTGFYGINFATAMPDVNYCLCGSNSDAAGGLSAVENWLPGSTTSQARIYNRNSGTGVEDNPNITVAIFR